MKATLGHQVELAMVRIGRVCKDARLSQNRTQAEQSELAEISLRAVQNIEAGQSGQTLILFKYLQSLGLLEVLVSALPDPEALTPLEQLAMEKARPLKPKRISRKRRDKAEEKLTPKWGDDHVD
ncbi:hypothetical protein NBRC116188_02520 [Oceaniserpentilla sp. 4NH20-0058]|uniref:hypothetical protein n=1 Tax=Oceaniserpentilla sp. 4NH20-0058 TaxID=3127660 RepID=UPI00310A032D